ncbi:MAG: tetratricopeptide repeat protein [Rhodospirillaceae bacterium]|nr:tetratricopeptide repeat protein [Rhodospirillaceae bacterium]MBT5080099.1 tetratricopeptide repeat protein [Rhodospirillaceae bacterium]MBT6219178.1 tetratricopeptide repeat protein [Rhodospirillaceae bacterium]MBT6913634.1 tetratricopeptide repeat protein [Rhodospirillaceae bacterium]MBT7284415.1 tetratricopeptide repeat protein [Rhodospirillaceae bacterium]
MANKITGQKNQSRIARHWGKATVVATLLVAFLGWYDVVRNKGDLFLCDVAALAGQKEAVNFCRKAEAPPDETNLLALLEYLKGREDQLSPERLAQLRELESHFEQRAFTVLMKSAGLKETQADAQTKRNTREALRETIEEGDADERRALAMIAEDDLDGGLQLLSDLAFAAAVENVAQWRRIGRLAYPVDTARALNAYEKIVQLDQSDPWDAIYLGRLHQRAGALSDAWRAYRDALARLPESEKRNRAVLLDGIANVLKDQGDLSAALQSYRAALVIRERLADADPKHAGWQRDLSVSYDNVANVLKDQGDLSAALQSYRAALVIAERLADADPKHAGWQRDLSVSYEKVGDLEEARGDIAAAIVEYENSLPIAQSLADRFPSHLQFQSDVKITTRRLTQLRAKLK